MLDTYYSEKLLELQGAKVKKVENSDTVKIHIVMQRKRVKCPACGEEATRIHDYRTQEVRDLPIFENQTILVIRKRRYICHCGKRFDEEIPFLARYSRRTKRMNEHMMNDLASLHSYSVIGRKYSVSTPTVMRIFDHIRYPKPPVLPEAIGIDEFKGNSGGEKYHCIITDLKKRKVIDILRTRKEVDLITYFKQYDRSKVRYFVSDMYKPYAEIAETYFKKATYVIDRYHWIRQMIWAFEAVRKDIQKRFAKDHRIYFKHSKGLLLKHRRDLKSEDDRLQVDNMLYLSPDLSTAYYYKEELYKILDMSDHQKQIAELRDWIASATECGVKPFEKCAETYRRWFSPIVNSLCCSYSNGFTEGCNNKIKVLKRNAFGLRDFARFRSRILFSFS